MGPLLAQCTRGRSAGFSASASYSYAAAPSSYYSAPSGLIRVGLVMGNAASGPVLTSAGILQASDFSNMGIASAADYTCAAIGTGLSALPSSLTLSSLGNPWAYRIRPEVTWVGRLLDIAVIPALSAGALFLNVR